MEVACPSCGETIAFDQPYPFHAGFGNQGSLYDDTGTLTLVWSSFDPAYEGIVGKVHPWALSDSQRQLLESRLVAAPNGARWPFSNPPCCTHCNAPIGRPITEDIYYYEYHGSVVTDVSDGASFASVVLDAGSTGMERTRGR